jgi:hypothetical protein
MIQKILMSAVIITFAFFGLSFVTAEESKCVKLYIDYGSLDNGTKLNNCIDVSTKIIALDLLEKANIKIEGTNRYGLDVVCRVNNLPNKNVESCDVMPPENAYWAIIIKEKQFLPFPTKEWGWGQVAINQQYLKPGDSIGLVWTGPSGKLKFP